MELIIKHFKELTAQELYEIYKLRVAVFVVEQTCPYQEVDNADQLAYHVYYKNESGIQAYLRVLPKGNPLKEISLGRVIAVKRRCGYGSKIVSAGIQVAQEKFGAQIIEIEAQTYARKMYEKIGFNAVSEEFLEDGIPHIRMILDLTTAI